MRARWPTSWSSAGPTATRTSASSTPPSATSASWPCTASRATGTGDSWTSSIRIRACRSSPGQRAGSTPSFQLTTPSSSINDLRLADAVTALRDAFADLHAFRDTVEAGSQRLRAFGIEPAETFSLLLDNEPEDGTGPGARGAAVVDDRALLPASLELDELTVGGAEYWSRVADQPNIDQALKDALRAAYPS